MKVITVGRNPGNNVVINDSLVSRHHLQIIQDDYGNFRLADFGSKNGTFVNGKRVTGEVGLNSGDIIRIGNTTLPWNSYFKAKAEPSRPFTPPPPVPPVHVPDEEVQSPSQYGIFVLLLGLFSLGLIAYIVINYFTSFGYQVAGMFGGIEGSLKLFPIYLKGYFGVGGQWIPIIAALALGIVADIVDSAITEEDGLSNAGKGMANFAIGAAVIFLALALFAEQIVKLY
ncbi:MAG: FHA domain-containing protein [Prevotellaceae bacterium]|jgi:hypothetical protein|nr:FHA domain-containing protein [Prevotellaceae bacterium]